MGYYPTPPEMVWLIRDYLKFPKGKFYALDPCCGEGTAIQLLTHDTNATTYGIELDKSRANQAKQKLDHVVNDAIENTVITEEKFSLLFLNPPYDWDESGERKETIFISETTKYLMPGGILIFIIPSTYIHHVMGIVSGYYEDIVRLDFPGHFYKPFKQTVLIGKKRKRPVYFSYESYKEHKTLGNALSAKYKVPSERGQIKTFISLKGIERNSFFTNAVWERFFKTAEESQISYSAPLLPLREGHISLLLACGYLDGQVGGHVAKGTVKEEIITEATGEKIKEKKVFKACIKILDAEGNIKELS